jgi:hypothetical protein
VGDSTVRTRPCPGHTRYPGLRWRGHEPQTCCLLPPRAGPTSRREGENASVRVRGGPPLCGAAFVQVAADRQGRS